MSANPNVPVLFYSERCSSSREVVQTIQALNKASLFRFVCIDTTPRQYIPQEIKSVPTIMNPQSKEVLVGKTAIFARISKPVDSRREVPQQRAAVQSQPSEWSFNDVRSISTVYSPFDEKTSLPDDQLRFSYIDGVRTSGQDAMLPNGSDMGESGARVSQNSDVSKRMEQLQAQRDSEFIAVSRA